VATPKRTKSRSDATRSAHCSRRLRAKPHPFQQGCRQAIARILLGLRWLAQLLRRLLGSLWQLVCGRWSIVQRLGAWLVLQLLEPVSCYGCIFTGVLLTTLLPASLWFTFALPAVNLVGSALTAFPFAELPDSADVKKAVFVALPLALVVFRRAYPEWRSSQDPLGARMLYACAAGVAWPKVWFRIRRSRQHGVS
jgi:hypothetical protein